MFATLLLLYFGIPLLLWMLFDLIIPKTKPPHVEKLEELKERKIQEFSREWNRRA